MTNTTLKSWLCLFFIFISFVAHAQNSERPLDFPFDGETLNGVLNLTENKKVKGIVLIVHGYGKTDAVEGNWYADVRQAMLSAGYATYMWDKMGCGESSGTFDINQPVEHSADEVIAAINMLRKTKIPGAHKIGLWGISRAGWINPLVIQKQSDIAFWVSVSGVDEKENFHYLLEQNVRIDSGDGDYAKLIANEWLQGTQIAHSGGSYQEYKEATKHLANNKFWLRFTDGGIGWLKYPFYKRDHQQLNLDEQTGLQIYVDGFETLLSEIDIPVLALFGERDMNVDWGKTKRLYQRVFETDKLTIHSFPNCNHNLFQANTGGYYEFADQKLPWKRCEGFLSVTQKWLEGLDNH